MKTKAFFLGLGVAILCESGLFAQTPAASPTPPQPPFLNRAPDHVQWTITYIKDSKGSGDGKVAENGSEPRGRTVAKDRDLVCEKTVNANNESFEAWRIGKGLMVTSSDGKKWVIGSGNQQGFDNVNYDTSDFSGFDWIGAQNFVGEKKVNGRPCLVFQDKVVTVEPSQLEMIKSTIDRDFNWMGEIDENGRSVNGAQTGAPARRVFNIEDYKIQVTAYIDAETRLPIALVYASPQGAVTRTYQFQALSTPLVMPDEVRKMLEAFKRRQKRLSVSHAPI